MRSPVTQPDDGVGMPDHVADGIEVAIGVVGQRPVQDRAAVILQQPVVHHLLRIAPLPRRLGGHGPVLRRFVIGRIAQFEDAAPVGDAFTQHGVVAGFRNDLRSERRLAQNFQFPSERKSGNLLPAWPSQERVLRDLEPQHHPGRPRQHLAEHRQALGIGIGDSPDDPPPFLRLRVPLQDRDRHRPVRPPDQPAQHVELRIGIIKVRNHLHPAGVDPAQRIGDGAKLRLLGTQRGDRLAGQRLVVDRA